MSKPYTKQNLKAFFAGVRAGYDAVVEANGSSHVVQGPAQQIFFPSQEPRLGDSVTFLDNTVPSNGFYTLNGPLYGSFYVIEGKISGVEIIKSKDQPRTVEQLNMERVALELMHTSASTPKERIAAAKAQAERTASDKAVKELNQKLGHIKHCLGIK
jgi:hypothetical protein